MADEISVQFTRFSAFYTPLIATIAGGFLKEEGFARPAFEATLDIFQHARLITKRHAYDDVVAPPPSA